MSNADQSAFPLFAYAFQEGLTKREYFAGLAMHGILANSAMMAAQVEKGKTLEEIGESIVKDSLVLADALLKELSKPTP